MKRHSIMPVFRKILAPFTILRKKRLELNRAALRSFGRRLVRALPAIMMFLVISHLMEDAGWFKSFETTSLDTILLAKKSLKAAHVQIVSIDEEAYQSFFGGKRPLNPDKLRELIDRVALGRPTVIGIDVDTSPPEYRGFHLSPDWPHIVWALDARHLNREKYVEEKGVVDIWRMVTDSLNPFREDVEIFKPLEVLGGEGKVDSGVAIPPYDPDGVIRRYRRVFATGNSPNSPPTGAINSFPWGVIKAYAERTGRKLPPEKVDPILYSSIDREGFKYPIDRILMAPAEDLRTDLENKIVLIGGAFAAARDEHFTRAGQRYGVEIMAQAIESDLQGVNIPPANTPLVKALEALAAITLIFLRHRFEKRKLALSLIAVVLLSLLCSLAVTNFTTLSLWAKFTPVLLAVLIQQLQDQVKSYQKSLAEKVEEHKDGLRKGLGQRFLRIVDK